MKSIKYIILTIAFIIHIPSISFSQDVGQEYIEAWKKFYPSKALAQGMHGSIFQYEDFSEKAIDNWVSYNKSALKELSNPSSTYVLKHHIDARLLKVQIQTEIDLWEKEYPHQTSLGLYSNLIERSISSVLNASYLTTPDKVQIICTRLEVIQKLSKSAEALLESSSKREVDRGLKSLNNSVTFLQEELSKQFEQEKWQQGCENLDKQLHAAVESIQSLITFVEKEIQPQAQTSTPILGREEYARRLRLYTDSQLSPEELEKLVREEITTTRNLIETVSKAYFQEKSPTKKLPKEGEELIRVVFDDMEKDAPKNGAEYLAFWQDLSSAAIDFIERNDIATLPTYQTLRIMPAPESAGAAARIGWVGAAPPFAPNPVTTLYLPSIPDTFPEQERIDFWSSFNKPFNRMIVIHELFPGHYMQLKISRETAHPVRLLFPYGPYIEGWATFTERVLLDEGWEKENKLTLLAHLRKRLENANRAYMSVQVHCNGWTQEQVMKFSIETSLLAPQFAKSLWGRLMRSPMQITSYFYGGKQISQLFEAEKKRLGDKFVLKTFMDTILKAGAIPIDEFPALLK